MLSDVVNRLVAYEGPAGPKTTATSLFLWGRRLPGAAGPLCCEGLND